MKAGLTGYAQVIGLYDTAPYDKLKMDLMYIESYSLLLDLRIILMTLKTALFPPESNEAKKKEMELLAKHKVNFIVLARYMQVISERMIDAYPNRIINIHHSFLPAFVGARPYHAAFERGVKIIGATSHYVTTELDAGPIIEQDVVRITHKDTVEDLVNKGKDLEKIVLSRAVQKHIERKVLAYKNKTVIFS